jgi:hypothetical protein
MLLKINLKQFVLNQKYNRKQLNNLYFRLEILLPQQLAIKAVEEKGEDIIIYYNVVEEINVVSESTII